MYPPDRKKSSYELQDWARVWLSSWDSRIYEIAGFDPIKYNKIVENCTVLDVARAWKTKMALSDFAWTDVGALMDSINWV